MVASGTHPDWVARRLFELAGIIGSMPRRTKAARKPTAIGVVGKQPFRALAWSPRVMRPANGDHIQSALQRSTRAIDQNHPLRALAALGLPDLKAPFAPGRNCHWRIIRPSGSSSARSFPSGKRATDQGRLRSLPTHTVATNRLSDCPLISSRCRSVSFRQAMPEAYHDTSPQVLK
jgi:hypothetical protein